MGKIANNLEYVRLKIKEAAEKTGKKSEEIKLVAVTKTIEVERIKEALTAGVTAIGENRVQEARGKYASLPQELEWHLIGSLQTNKVKQAVEIFAMIHSVDRIPLANEISKQCVKLGKTMDVLIQVNISGEETKQGADLEEAESLVRYAAALPGIRVKGLMTIAPFVEEPQEARPVFRRLKKMQEELQKQSIVGIELDYLSMGMTNDFMVAIEEGANIVRVGSGIFGERN